MLNTKIVALQAREKSGQDKENSLLDSYLKDIGRFTVLTDDEESELCRQWQALKNQSAALAQKLKLAESEVSEKSLKAKLKDEKDEIDRKITEIKDQFIQGYLRFVVRIAKSYQHQGLPFIDLIGEGNIGLQYAINHYNPARGVKFISYAVWWVRQTICRGLAYKRSIIRLPVRIAYMTRAMQAAIVKLSYTKDNPSADDIAKDLGWPKEKVLKMMNYMKMTALVSLDEEIMPTDNNGLAPVSIINYYNPCEAAIKSLIIDNVRKMISTLPEIEQQIIKLRYGTNDRKLRPLLDIAAEVHLSVETVRQILKRVIPKLGRRLNSAVFAPNSRP